MKKILVLSILFLLTLSANAGQITSENEAQLKRATFEAQRIKREQAFEQKLGLTVEQKIKAKELRKKGHEKLRPVIEEIKQKKQEAEMVKRSRIAVQAQEERLDAIDAELKVLEKKAHDIRRANMKDFESILTREQKKILKQMKKDGRKNYQKSHPNNMKTFGFQNQINTRIAK